MKLKRDAKNGFMTRGVNGLGKWFFVEQVHAFFKYDSYDSSTYVLFLIFRLIWGNEIQLNESASVGWRSLVDTLGPAFSWADLWIVLHARDPMVTELSLSLIHI